jgi:hypothetical protein
VSRCRLKNLGRPLVLSLAVCLLAACQSSGLPAGAYCEPRRGMTSAELVSCGCEMVDSGGAATRGGPSGPPETAVTVADYVCPAGGAGLARVSLVDGVVREVFH